MSVAQLANAVERLALQMGFEWFLVVQFGDGFLTEVVQNIHNAPSELRAWLRDTAALRRDKVIARAVREPIPFSWDRSSYESSPEDWHLMDLAGYRSGLAARTTGGRDQCCVLVVGTGREEPVPESLRMMALADLLLASGYVQSTLERLEPRPTPRLRPREVECLRWCTYGKTAKETAKMLGITERTVNQHLGRAMSQLGVNSKAAAVTRAHLLGLLAPADARGAGG